MVDLRLQRAVLGFLLIASCGMVGCGQGSSEVGPVLIPGSIDFGEVLQGAGLEGSFLVRNAGSQPITITGVRSGCGCVLLEGWGQDVILAGGAEHRVSFRLDTGLKHGEIGTRIMVLTDPPSRPLMSYQVNASVIRPYQLSVPQVEFGSVMLGDCGTEVVRVRADDGREIALEHWRVLGGSAPVSVSDVGQMEDGWREFALVATPDAVGHWEGVIRLSTLHELAKTISIPFKLRGIPPIAITPKGLVDFGECLAESESGRRVRVDGSRVPGFAVVQVHVRSRVSQATGCVVAEWSTGRAGGVHDIDLLLSAPSTRGHLFGMVDIITNYEAQPVFSIPISGVVKN